MSFDSSFDLDSFIDVIRQNVSLSCKLPYTLGNDNIERIIKYDALRYFYREYKFANHKTYYYVDLISMFKNKSVGTKFITLPNEIEAVLKIHMVNYNEMRNLGYMVPGNSLSLGQTSTPFVAAINVSEFGESMGAMQTLQDAMNNFSKSTTKFYFDVNSKRFEVMTSLDRNIVLEVYAHIPEDALFGDPWFIKYVTGIAMMDYSTHLSFTDMQLAGNTKISTDRIYDRGTLLVTEVKEYIKTKGVISYSGRT